MYFFILFIRGPEIEDDDDEDYDSISNDNKHKDVRERNGATNEGKPLSLQQV